MASLPPDLATEYAHQKDRDQLQMLSVFFYIYGGINFLGVVGGLFYIALGAGMAGIAPTQGAPEAALFGGIFVLAGGIFSLFMFVWSALFILAGRAVGRQKYHTFCLVMAALACASLPIGTALGIFTFIVLSRPHVQDLFRQNVHHTL